MLNKELLQTTKSQPNRLTTFTKYLDIDPGRELSQRCTRTGIIHEFKPLEYFDALIYNNDKTIDPMFFKWMTMSQLVLTWSRNGFYQFKENLITYQVRFPQSKNQIYLLLENSLATLYDHVGGCIWSPFIDFKFSDQKNKQDRPLYIIGGKFARLNIHPTKLQDDLIELQKVGLKIEHFYNAEMLFRWFANRIGVSVL